MSTHHTPGELKVKIKVAAGLIETRTHEGDDTIVEIEPLDDRESSRQAVEKAREELRGGELMIEVPEQSRFGFRGGDAQVRVTVDAPKGAHINTRTASADARLMGDLGSIDGVSASGALIAEQVAGDVDFKSASGDLSVDGIGRDANLNTVSGDVQIGQAGGDVNVASVSGDAALRAVSRGEASVKSVSGDINVGVVAGTKVWLDVNSMSGDTSSDLDPSDAPATANGESLRLKATSTSGDVRITRSTSAAPAG